MSIYNRQHTVQKLFRACDWYCTLLKLGWGGNVVKKNIYEKKKYNLFVYVFICIIVCLVIGINRF
jgi:hypothetical protein